MSTTSVKLAFISVSVTVQHVTHAMYLIFCLMSCFLSKHMKGLRVIIVPIKVKLSLYFFFKLSTTPLRCIRGVEI
jgi:hypothetical protein